MGRFAIHTSSVDEEVDTYVEAWRRALALRAAGHGTVQVTDTAKPGAPVDKKAKGKKVEKS